MVLNEDVSLQHACERFEPEVSLGRLAAFSARALFFIDIDLAAIFGGIDPGAAEARSFAHERGGGAAAAAVATFRILAARYFQRVGRDREFHLLDGHRGHIRHAYAATAEAVGRTRQDRSEEHTSELPSLMRNSYAVCSLYTKNKPTI